jgi:hypothetical protein
MNAKQVIAKGIGVVVFLFAAFGGFLKGVAPPGDADSRFAVGLSSLLALVALLSVSVVAQRKQVQYYRAIVLTAAVVLGMAAAVTGFIYKSDLVRLTFSYPPENPQDTYVKGTVYTQDAQDYLQKTANLTDSQLVAAFGAPPNSIELVWTVDSIHAARLTLIVYYVIFVLTIAAAVFALAEGLLA